ncbi:hypothetical protein CVT26_001226 [Gymnopilus dilepis]|uniref:Uncharacterized protein n=1 Tax=Gymnopilus dilepis TaxID=231916 RepID=A0A409YUI3_9AGAR|nr:hypothetical protein CVT26_001226 [Gymnopilus dilepis]
MTEIYNASAPGHLTPTLEEALAALTLLTGIGFKFPDAALARLAAVCRPEACISDKRCALEDAISDYLRALHVPAGDAPLSSTTVRKATDGWVSAIINARGILDFPTEDPGSPPSLASAPPSSGNLTPLEHADNSDMTAIINARGILDFPTEDPGSPPSLASAPPSSGNLTPLEHADNSDMTGELIAVSALLDAASLEDAQNIQVVFDDSEEEDYDNLDAEDDETPALVAAHGPVTTAAAGATAPAAANVAPFLAPAAANVASLLAPAAANVAPFLAPAVAALPAAPVAPAAAVPTPAVPIAPAAFLGQQAAQQPEIFFVFHTSTPAPDTAPYYPSLNRPAANATRWYCITCGHATGVVADWYVAILTYFFHMPNQTTRPNVAPLVSGVHRNCYVKYTSCAAACAAYWTAVKGGTVTVVP